MLRIEPSLLCRGDVGALVTDGANTICDRFASTASIVSALVLMAATAFVWRATAARRNVILAGATVLSLPGLYALAVQRADAPLHVRETAARLARIERGLEDDARLHGCVGREPSRCEVCQPIARFARARPDGCARELVPRAPASTNDGGAAGGPALCAGDDLGCGAP